MRNLLTEEGLYTALFDNTCQTLAKVFEVDFTKQRLDLVHIKSNMRHLGRISLFSRTIKEVLINLKIHRRTPFDKLDQDRFLRYINKKEESLFAAVKPSETSHTLDRLAQDAFFLIEQFAAIEKISNMSSYKLLARLFKEQCISEDDNDGGPIIIAKSNKDVKSDSLQNPSEPDAGYKGQGYQVQVMETYSTNPDEKSLSLITHVKVESADESDNSAITLCRQIFCYQTGFNISLTGNSQTNFGLKDHPEYITDTLAKTANLSKLPALSIDVLIGLTVHWTLKDNSTTHLPETTRTMDLIPAGGFTLPAGFFIWNFSQCV